MCISSRASVNAFLVNLFSAISLVHFGNENLKSVNLIIAIFSVFTSLMQLIDLAIWQDLDCKSGLNKFATAIGPVLTYFQPIAVFIVAYLVMNYTKHGQEKQATDLNPLENNSKLFDMFSTTSNKLNVSKIVNIISAIVLVILLGRYYNSDKNTLCSTLSGPHIKWGWLSTSKPDIIIYMAIYAIISLMNFYFIDPLSMYVKIAIFGYVTLYFVSRFMNKNYTGELWCLTSNMLPLLFLIIQKIFKNQLQR
jgi:hypothetical protein